MKIVKKIRSSWIVGAAFAAFGGMIRLPSDAQTLIHRYSFNGSARDSIGGADGMMVGVVGLQSSSGVNGSADFSGSGMSGSVPNYIRMPVSAVSGLQNATMEFFTTNFNPPKSQIGAVGGQYQTLFSAAGSYGTTTNFVNLTPNFSGAGLGFSAQRNGSGSVAFTAHDPLPCWRQNHIVDFVFSGFSGVGSVGTVTLYLDGQQIAQGKTACSLAAVAAGAGGINAVGIGGGSPYNDPNFSGSLNEFRIFNGALTAPQIAANVSAGPSVIGAFGIVTGRVALEGVSDLSKISSAVPAPAITVEFRSPGSAAPLSAANVTLTPVGAGSPFGTFLVSNVPIGTADIAIKGSKQLRALFASVSLGSVTTLPDVTLLTGDANNDNSIDSSDFGILIGAFNTSAAIPGNGYDATADFNNDGAVDSTDFGLLIGNYNLIGAP